MTNRRRPVTTSPTQSAGCTGRDGVDSRRDVPDGVRPTLSGGAPGASGPGGRVLDRPVLWSPTSSSAASWRPRATSTFAERPPDPADYPGALPEMLYAGSMVFMKPDGPVDRSQIGNWWSYMKGADWRHPYGPRSFAGRPGALPRASTSPTAMRRPMPRWAGKELPDRSGVGVRRPGRSGRRHLRLGRGVHARRASSWPTPGRGSSPGRTGWRTATRARRRWGRSRRTATACFDMIGNVWEWTTDWYGPRMRPIAPKACCVPRNPRGGGRRGELRSRQPEIRIPRKVLKGGSHLCAPNYCRRYRPAARFPEPVDTSTCHLGFRCIIRSPGG